MVEYLDCTDSIDNENISRILNYLARHTDVPYDAIQALRNLHAEVKRLQGEHLADKPNGNDNRVAAYWTCEICGKVHEKDRYGGYVPKYCSSDDGELTSCQREARRRQTAERVKAYRARQKAAERG